VKGHTSRNEVGLYDVRVGPGSTTGPAPTQRLQDLLGETDFAVGGHAKQPQVPGLNAVLRQSGCLSGDFEVFHPVPPGGVDAEQTERLQRAVRRHIQPAIAA